MKIAAVLVDSWKLSIFKKHLDAAGFKYTEHAGVINDTLNLRVEYDWVARLKPIVEAANAECVTKGRDNAKL